MGQGQIGFQPLLQLNKLCPILPSKQTAIAQPTSDCELPSLAWTCFIYLLQNPTETPQSHFQWTLGSNRNKIQWTFKAGRKYKTLKPNHPTYSVSVSGFYPSPGNLSSMWEQTESSDTSFFPFRRLVVDEAQEATILKYTYKMMAYLQDILLISQAWRMNKSNSMICMVGNLGGIPAPYVKFSARAQWKVGYFYLGKLLFQACGRIVKIGEA